MNLGLTNVNVMALVTDFTCGYCKVQTGYNIVYADRCEETSLHGDFLGGRGFAVLECRTCKMLNLITLRISNDLNEYPAGADFDEPVYLTEHPDVLHTNFDQDTRTIQPLRVEYCGQFPAGVKVANSVSEGIKRDLEEAANCLSVDAANAALLMCRRVIERIVRSLGIPSKRGSLHSMIQELNDLQKIPSEFIEAFFEIKDWGNIGAHSKDEEYETVTLEEARQVLNTVQIIVDRLYTPLAIDQLNEKRVSKRKLSSSPIASSDVEENPF